MNSRQFCSKALLPAMAALALQGCADVDPVPLRATAPVPTTGDMTIDRARELINLPAAYPANTEVQVSMILRNLPDMTVSELGPGTRAALYDCSTSNPCVVERDPNYHGTDYSHEFDGTFLAAAAIGGGSWTGAASAAGGGISPASISFGKPGATLGIAWGTQNARLYSANHDTNQRRWEFFRYVYNTNTGERNPQPIESPEPNASRYLNLWKNPWPSSSWELTPLNALQDALTNDMDSEAHVLYFSPALFPIDFIPGLTCVPVSGAPEPDLRDCIEAAFGQNTAPRYQRPGAVSSFLYSHNTFNWLRDIYNLMVDSAHNNAIIVVPAGDHGGEITDSSYFLPRRDLPLPDYINTAALMGFPRELLTTERNAIRNAGQTLNALFFADGLQVPTNIFAWVPAVSLNPTNVLPVVAVNPQGSISDASSQCGTELADYCVAAPGFYFSIASGQRAGSVGAGVGGESIVLPGGDVLGSCVAPTSLEQSSFAVGTTDCYTTMAGPRLMWTLDSYFLGNFNQAWIRGSGSTVWDADSMTLTLPSPVGATEVAAAITTGALTLIAAHFKSAGTAMSAADLLARLRMTADKTGIYADTSIYGQGLIDVQAAISPQGGGGIALTELARGARAPLAASALVLHSGLFGDALRSAFAGQSFVALDDLHAPFRYPLDSLLQSRQHSAHLQVAAPLERSVQRLSDGSLLHINRGSAESVSLAFQQGALGMHLTNDTHPGLSFGSVAESSDLARTATLQADSALFAPWAAADRQWHGFGAEVEIAANQRVSLSRYRALDRDDTELADDPNSQNAIALTWQADFAIGRFGLQHVRSRSADELLGIEVSGGLGSIADGRIDAANSWGLIELSARSRILFSLWHLRARADNLAQGTLSSVDGLTADSWALAFMLSGAANTDLTLRLEQPLRAHSGTLHFNVPTGYTPDRRIQFSALTADTTPSGRELRVQADLSFQLGERGGRLQLSAGSAREPGHVRNASNDPYALIGLSLPL